MSLPSIRLSSRRVCPPSVCERSSPPRRRDLSRPSIQHDERSWMQRPCFPRRHPQHGEGSRASTGLQLSMRSDWSKLRVWREWTGDATLIRLCRCERGIEGQQRVGAQPPSQRLERENVCKRDIREVHVGAKPPDEVPSQCLGGCLKDQ